MTLLLTRLTLVHIHVYMSDTGRPCSSLLVCLTDLILTHVSIFRINTIMDSDRVLVMHAGKVAEFDTPSALCQNDQSIFHRLVGGGGGEWAKTQRGLMKVELETWCFLYLTTEMSCWFSLNDKFLFFKWTRHHFNNKSRFLFKYSSVS